MAGHDSVYHKIFGHPGMVAQLLREFVAEPWLDALDLDGMERLNAKFHSDTGERREGDMIWRIHRHGGGGDTYLMLLLEFQSTPDRWMALRALVYVGLLWQHLVREKDLPRDGRLPPVMAVVVYNGDRRWTAPLALDELVGLPTDTPLWRFQPACCGRRRVQRRRSGGARYARGAAVSVGGFARPRTGCRPGRRNAGVVRAASGV
jgi:hypothetical protein